RSRRRWGESITCACWCMTGRSSRWPPAERLSSVRRRGPTASCSCRATARGTRRGSRCRCISTIERLPNMAGRVLETTMLTDSRVEDILQRIPSLTVGVLGDLFLDRYLDLDDRLTEPSLETGLPAYQVVGVRPSPGAAGTVINNLVALSVQR